jgi:hypothetical protein
LGKGAGCVSRMVRVWCWSVAAGCILVACSGPAPPTARVVSPEQARMDELMRQNETRASEPDLADAYGIINAQYFDNRLPPVRIRWEAGLDQIGPLIAENFRLEGLTNGSVILLHPALEQDPRQLRAVLCHEMVHVALRDQPHTHGPEFQARLRALAGRGAFEGIVATEEEKGALKESLERTTRRLAGDLHELRQLQGRIEAEAPSLPRDVVQDRIWEYNKRVRQHNEDVDAFNRDVERYNLMIKYPDGLDRERLVRKSGAAEIAR